MKAWIETLYVCPACGSKWNTRKEAVNCRNRHQIKTERWAVNEKGRAVRIFDNCSPNGSGGEPAALEQARKGV